MKHQKYTVFKFGKILQAPERWEDEGWSSMLRLSA